MLHPAAGAAALLAKAWASLSEQHGKVTFCQSFYQILPLSLVGLTFVNFLRMIFLKRPLLL